MKPTQPVRVAIIGAGGVSSLQYAPALLLDRRAQLVAVCDANPQLASQKALEWGVTWVDTDCAALFARAEQFDAVIIATPNDQHVPIALAALKAGKHVLCEKPLGLSSEEVRSLYEVARDSGQVHMTAFTYRFAPSMKFLRHLVHSGSLGQPRHFRSQRFLDWPETSWGWRQYRERAGAGDLYDMTIHRLDLAVDLLGPVQTVCGAVAQFAERTRTATGDACPPSDVDDWSALIGRFRSGATGVWEGTTLAKGQHGGTFGHDWVEINGSEGTAVYRLAQPNHIWLGRHGEDLHATPVPGEFLKPEGSHRSVSEPHPAVAFRYDLAWEFISAILEQRDAIPSFYDGLVAQRLADAVLQSQREARWIELGIEPR